MWAAMVPGSASGVGSGKWMKTNDLVLILTSNHTPDVWRLGQIFYRQTQIGIKFDFLASLLFMTMSPRRFSITFGENRQTKGVLEIQAPSIQSARTTPPICRPKVRHPSKSSALGCHLHLIPSWTTGILHVLKCSSIIFTDSPLHP